MIWKRSSLSTKRWIGIAYLTWIAIFLSEYFFGFLSSLSVDWQIAICVLLMFLGIMIFVLTMLFGIEALTWITDKLIAKINKKGRDNDI